jgi:integrase/recombinase XerD
MPWRTIMSEPTLIATWIRRFLLEHLVSERNLSINTQRSYRDMLLQLLPFIATQLRKPIERLTVADISPKRVRQFLGQLELTRHCGARTRNQRLSAIHALARFVGEHAPEHLEWCAQVRLIPFKKTMEPAITCLDRQEMQALLAAPRRSTSQGERDYAVLLFLYNSGARASEAAVLTIADVDWHAQSVRILGKGQRTRTCPLWPATLKVLRSLTAGRVPTERVFMNRNRKPITRSGIHALVKRYAKRARQAAPSLANKAVGPHAIRHSTASHLLRSGVDINTIRGWLGHVSLDTTNIYAEIDLETKARALAACTIADEHGRRAPSPKRPSLMQFLQRL